MADIVITPVLIMGLILGIIELFFVAQDESGLGWLKHGLHAIPTMLIFIFISMNISFVLGLVGLQANMWIDIGVRIIVGIIAMLKIKGAAAIAGKVGVTFVHALILGVLVMVAPYIWELVVCAYLPFVKTLPLNGCPAPPVH